jgi:hypothetical protein
LTASLERLRLRQVISGRVREMARAAPLVAKAVLLLDLFVRLKGRTLQQPEFSAASKDDLVFRLLWKNWDWAGTAGSAACLEGYEL